MVNIYNENNKSEFLNKEYPRILLLTRNDVDQYGPKGASIGNWFQFWSKDSIAIMCSHKNIEFDYCMHYYILSAKDVRFSKIYNKLRKLKKLNSLPINTNSKKIDIQKKSIISINKMKELLLRICTAYYDRFFDSIISKEMNDFIKSFDPEIILLFAEDLQMIRWADKITKKFKKPIIVELEDNWFSRDSDLQNIERKALRHTRSKLGELLKQAKKIYVIGEKMQSFLKDTFLVDSEILYCVDSSVRYKLIKNDNSKESFNIVYCGSIGARLDTLKDLYDAVYQLRNEYYINLEVFLYGNWGIYNDPTYFSAHWCHIESIPVHEQIPETLAQADLLFLGETYNPFWMDYVSLAVSSKTHIYMMTGHPIIVYGPEWAGVVEYAKQGGFSLVVQAPNLQELKKEIFKLYNDSGEIRQSLKINSEKSIKLNHEAVVVCERLRNQLAFITKEDCLSRGQNVQTNTVH